MAVVKINLSCELSEAVKVQYLHGNLFSQDNQANVINVAVFEDGEPVELAGTVTANVIRPDGGTVAVTGGTYSGNVATITMPSAVYAIPGAISVAVKITLDSVVTTIAAFAATVYATSTDTAIDPGTIIPSIQTLIAEIEAAVDSIPADYSSLWATLAPNYSNLTFPVAVGQYCTYDGGFYRCNTAIATQEAWTAAHWTATNIGADLAETRLDVANLEDDVSELKSAIGTVPTGKTVQGQIEVLQTGKADMIVVTDSIPAAVMSFPDGADGLPMALKVAVEPVQDLHGYENPWPAGGGKNLLPVTCQTETKNDITLTVNKDADGNVISLKINGTASANTSFLIGSTTLPAGSYIASKGADGARPNLNVYDPSTAQNIATVAQSAASFTLSESKQVDFYVYAFSGDSFSNVMLYPMIRLASVSDATFAPCSNICPISGWTGAKISRMGFNVWDEQWEVGTFDNNTGEKAVGYNNIRSKNHIPVKPNTTYAKPTISMRILYYDASKSYLGYDDWNSNSTFTTLNNAYYVMLRIHDVYGTTYNHDISINYPSTDHDYHAYSGTTLPITFPSSAGTVYGGTLTLNQDGTGLLVVDKASVDLGTLIWNASSRYGMYSEDSNLKDYIKKPSSNTEKVNAITSFKQVIDWATFFNPGTPTANTCSVNASGAFGVSTTETDPAAFKQSVSGQQLVYELATPVTYTLTAPQVKTLLGVNNIWADTGDILSVDYPADTKLYVDQQIAEKVSASQRLMELIVTANREDTMTATKAYSSGDLLIVNGTLYKASTSIANGATLTEGTNVTATTVAAEIAALA